MLIYDTHKYALTYVLFSGCSCTRAFGNVNIRQLLLSSYVAGDKYTVCRGSDNALSNFDTLLSSTVRSWW